MTTPTDPGQGPFAPPYQPAHPPQPAHSPQLAHQPQGSAPAQEAAPSPDGGAPWGSTPHRGEPAGQAAPPRREPRRMLTAVAVPLMAVCLLAGLLLGLLVAPPLLGDDGAAPELPPSRVTPGTGGSAGGDLGEESVAAIAADVLPSTVYIEVAAGQQSGSGSGFVLREDGYVVTNQHVIAAARDGGGRITVVFADGSESEAEVVGASVDYDLAVLRVDADGLRPLVLGDSDALVVGEPVVAIGAPLGLEGTVTSGIVSALNRPVSIPDEAGSTFINAIQTDAAINPGNSGGPLVNAAGEVIGVNSAIATTATAGQAGSVGLGFAIPSSQVRRTTEQLIETGRATYPVIGALLDTTYTGEGVQVVAAEDATDIPPITPGGPADAAGLQAGDVIVAIDGDPVTSPDELIVRIRAHSPGDVVTLTVRDGGTDTDLQVTLGESESR